jgi:hypothetical protein
MMVDTNSQCKSGEDQFLDREPGHESDIDSNRRAHRYGTENVSDTQNHRSPSIGYLPLSPEEQELWQGRTLSMSFEANSAEQEEESEIEAQATGEEGMKYRMPLGAAVGDRKRTKRSKITK